MKTLVIYDNKGTIFLQRTGTYDIPQGGVQYLEIEIPSTKIVTSINTSVTPKVPVYEDIPLTETELLKKRIEEQEQAIVELASMLGGAV
jgi:hypothetical protein